MVLQIILFLVLGLVFGSFISALTWRTPLGISINKGRSICPNCKHMISWYDNIPLLSYILLRGKCRNCKKHISLRYPIIETVASIGFVCLWLTNTSDYLRLMYFLAIFVILFSIFVIDLEHRLIPDSFVFTGIFISVIYFLLSGSQTLFLNILIGLSSATLLLLIHIFTEGRGMGLGDVKFAVLGGMIIGSRLFLIWLFLAFLTGAAVGIILIISKKARLKSQIAFGPFLVAAIPLTLTYGEKILFWIHLS